MEIAACASCRTSKQATMCSSVSDMFQITETKRFNIQDNKWLITSAEHWKMQEFPIVHDVQRFKNCCVQSNTFRICSHYLQNEHPDHNSLQKLMKKACLKPCKVQQHLKSVRTWNIIQEQIKYRNVSVLMSRNCFSSIDDYYHKIATHRIFGL